MPLFTFVCKKCEYQFETLIDRDCYPKCPECGNDETEKQLPHIFFKVVGGETAARATTPTLRDNPDSVNVCARVAHIADKNTGESLGYSAPEVIVE
jgi:putative FmdB family regulatory protein